jgi:POT family proton-dependent oligopeptide transporter
MLLGLISYKVGEDNLGDAGYLETDLGADALAQRSRRFWSLAAGAVALIVAFAFLMSTGVIGLSLESLAHYLGYATVVIALGFFAFIIFFGGHTTHEKKQLGVILWLFILAALFWSGFEQAGSSLNLFAERETDRMFGPYGWLDGALTVLPAALIALPLGYVSLRVFSRKNLWWVGKAGVAALSMLVIGFTYYISLQVTVEWQMPASMLQNINPLFIVTLAPVFGFGWTWLAARDANPSIPVKFALGLFGLAAGFFVISWGAANASGPNSVAPAWLVVTYFLHTCGELCLSPVGLSSMTKLAPENRVGQMMGMWFVAAALGNLMAGLVAGRLETLQPGSLFFTVALIIGGGGLVALLASPFVKRLMGDVE